MNIPDYETRKKSMDIKLNNISWNTKGINDKLKIDKEWCRKVKNFEVVDPIVGVELAQDEKYNPGSLEKWFKELSGHRKQTDTIIHFPMIICEKSTTEGLEQVVFSKGSYMSRLLKRAPYKERQSNYLALSGSDRPPKTSSKIDKGDLILNSNVSKVARKMMSKRGVQAKTVKKKRNHDEMMKDDKSLDPSFCTIELEDYLGTEFQFDGEPNDIEDVPVNSDYDLDSNERTEFTQRWLDIISLTPEFKALEFHDRVLAEVITNSTRNPGHDQYIMRKIRGFLVEFVITSAKTLSWNSSALNSGVSEIISSHLCVNSVLSLLSRS
jgi:hypothetical protein